MSTTTTNISLTKPAVGETGWGTSINGNFDTIDSEINTIKVTTIPLKSNISGPTFTGVPAAPTAEAGTNTTQIATTAFTKTAVDTMGGTKANTSHTHAEGDITNLTSDLSGKAPTSHTHAIANINAITASAGTHYVHQWPANGMYTKVGTLPAQASLVALPTAWNGGRWMFGIAGTYRLYIYISGNWTTNTMQWYKNGSVTGTLHSFSVGQFTDYGTFTQDITVAAGDYLDLYYTACGAVNTAIWKVKVGVATDLGSLIAGGAIGFKATDTGG